MFRMSHHIHIHNTMFMQSIDNVYWWDADRGDEEFGTFFDDNVDQLVEGAFGVVVL